MESRSGKVYQRTTVYLTAEQRQWLRRVAAQAQLNDVPMSASDVVRLAIARLRDPTLRRQASQSPDRAHPSRGRGVSRPGPTRPTSGDPATGLMQIPRRDRCKQLLPRKAPAPVPQGD